MHITLNMNRNRSESNSSFRSTNSGSSGASDSSTKCSNDSQNSKESVRISEAKIAARRRIDSVSKQRERGQSSASIRSSKRGVTAVVVNELNPPKETFRERVGRTLDSISKAIVNSVEHVLQGAERIVLTTFRPLLPPTVIEASNNNAILQQQQASTSTVTIEPLACTETRRPSFCEKVLDNLDEHSPTPTDDKIKEPSQKSTITTTNFSPNTDRRYLAKRSRSSSIDLLDDIAEEDEEE